MGDDFGMGEGGMESGHHRLPLTPVPAGLCPSAEMGSWVLALPICLSVLGVSCPRLGPLPGPVVSNLAFPHKHSLPGVRVPSCFQKKGFLGGRVCHSAL